MELRTHFEMMTQLHLSIYFTTANVNDAKPFNLLIFDFGVSHFLTKITWILRTFWDIFKKLCSLSKQIVQIYICTSSQSL